MHNRLRRLARHLILAARKDDYLKRLENSRPDLDPEEEAQKLLDLNNPKKEKMALHWICRKTLRLPEDQYKLDRAYRIIDRLHLDFQKYRSPMEVIESNSSRIQRQVQRIDFDPKKERAFSNPYNAGSGVIIYQVEESREGQLATRRAIDANWGIDADPWCIAARDDENLKENHEDWFLLSDEEKREIDLDQLDVAWSYWRDYDAYPKRIAFQNGKLLAFCAYDKYEIVWWNRTDDPSYNIPASSKVEDDIDFCERYTWSKIEQASDLNADPEVLRDLAIRGGDYTIMKVARNPSTPEDVIRDMIEHTQNDELIITIAENPGTPADILSDIFRDKEKYGRNLSRNYMISALARNKSTPVDVLEDISKIHIHSFRAQVVSNPSLPMDVVERLSRDINGDVRLSVARRNDLQYEILNKLTNDLDQRVRLEIAKKENLPLDLVYKLIGDEDLSTVREASKNKSIPQEEFRRLVEENRRSTTFLLKNPYAPDDLLMEFSDDEKASVRYAVSSNKNCPAAVLEKLVDDSNGEVRSNVAKNLETPTSALEKLSMDKDVMVRASVAGNVMTPKNILRELSRGAAPMIRAQVAKNINTPREVLVELSKDKNLEVRAAAAENWMLPDEILIGLSNDASGQVRKKAQETLMEKRKANSRKTSAARDLRRIAEDLVS